METDHQNQRNPLSNDAPLLLTFFVISLFIIYLIYTKNIIFGSQSGGWVFPYFDSGKTFPAWILVTTVILAAGVIFCGSKAIARREGITLLVSLIALIVLQILMQLIYRFPMSSIIESDSANSFYTSSLKYSPTTLFSQYTGTQTDLVYHARSNLPGKILLFDFLAIFTPSTQTMGDLIIIISSLGGLILYGICKHLFRDRLLAFYAFVLYALVPGKQLYFPILNTVTPVFILLCLYLLILYIEFKRTPFLIALGFCLYLLVLFEPSPLVMGLLFIGILLQAIAQKKILPKDIIPIVAFTTLAFGLTYLLFYLLFSFDLLQAVRFVLHDAVQFNQNKIRRYGIWLGENVKEFFFANGIPCSMIVLYSIISLVCNWKTEGINVLHWSMDTTYQVLLLLTFGVVLFLGINRGETTRLWIYLEVFFQVPVAAFVVKKTRNPAVFFLLASLLLLQSGISLHRVDFLNP